MAHHPDLAAEQAYVDRAYERLDAMREAATAALHAALAQARGGTHQSLVERDVLVHTNLQRLSRLELGRESLCFGRIDRDTGESFHIGRLPVSDEHHEPLVIDWRAPAAEPFYRATGREPLGLRRRRHFLTEGRKLLDLEDELFGGEEGEELGLTGSSALRAALERARTGRMRDIVATVQREQDEVIRAPLPGVLVVQGGPGTGKTAVALHRAAYLLYTHRFPLERQGVLVVGPNRLFMRYIEHVLPSLGESGVAMSTVGGLVRGVEASGTDGAATARLKGDPRMARVLVRALKDRERPLRRDLAVGVGPFILRLTAAESADLVRSARRRSGPHNPKRALIERLLFQRLHGRYTAAVIRRGREPPPRASLASDPAAPDPPGFGPAHPPAPAPEASRLNGDLTVAELARTIRRDPAVVEALERMWPVLTPEQLLRDLFGAPALVASAAAGVLSSDEQRALHRPRGAEGDDRRWSPADLPLLDEAAALLGPHRRRAPEEAEPADDEQRTFGHIVVDEAQDLTPMQLRMLARRSLSGSMTLVGDLAQATGPWAPGSWDEVLAHLPARRGAKVAELSVNYRTPAEIMALAGRVLAAAIPGARVPESVRTTGESPRAVRAASTASLPAETAAVSRQELAAVGDGTVAVICPPSLEEALAEAFDGAGVPFGQAADGALDAPVTLVPVDLVKGLEFDGVVVVEPGRVAWEATSGLQALYVALTRSTRRLALVHAEPLPIALEP